jgi:hypothetical protein
MLDARYWMLDARYWILDAGYWMLDKKIRNSSFYPDFGELPSV